MDYQDFILRIGPAIDRNKFAVAAASASEGEARGEFIPPFDETQLENFVLKVGLTRRGVRKIHSPEWQAAQVFGQQLFSALFTDELRALLLASRNAASHNGKGLRIKIVLDAPALANYPWEFLYDPGQNRFLTLFEATPIVRYLEFPAPVTPLRVALPLHILGLTSSPTDYPPLNVERERGNLSHAVADLQTRGLLTITWLRAATLEVLAEALLKNTFHIFHFIGHGGFDASTRDGVLLFEDQARRGRCVSAERLAIVLGNHPSLRLAILNACEGGRTSVQDPFAGAAMTLVRSAGIPAVVAMQFEITDTASVAFSQGLYSAIAAGRPVDAAVTQARLAVFAQDNDIEWGTPVLYLRAPDGVIFTPEEQSQAEQERAAHERRERERSEAEHLAQAQAEVDRLARKPAEREPVARPKPVAEKPASRAQPIGKPRQPTVTLGAIVIAIVGLLVLCGIGAYAIYPTLFPATPTPPVATPKPLEPSPTPAPPTARPTNTTVPTPLGGGKGRISFVSSRNGNQDIYVMNVDGSGQTRLTNDSAGDSFAAWSPDGQRIAFDSDRDGNHEIYVMNADGSGQTRLTNNLATDMQATWSPDGKRIAFVSHRDGNDEIYVMNVDGSAQTRLTNHPAPDSSPAWSPDGRRIAFDSERDGSYEIYVMNADGSVQTRLTNNSANDGAPAWSPDGRRIAFDSVRDGQAEIYVMNADGSGQTRLTNNTANDYSAAWSPDGRWLAFTSDRDGNTEIYVINVDGSGQTNVTKNAAYDYVAQWQP